MAKVPSMNDVPLHYLKPNSLVKFRCLIQDMFDPEFYMGTYETVDPSTKAKVSAPPGFVSERRFSKFGVRTWMQGCQNLHRLRVRVLGFCVNELWFRVPLVRGDPKSLDCHTSLRWRWKISWPPTLKMRIFSRGEKKSKSDCVTENCWPSPRGIIIWREIKKKERNVWYLSVTLIQHFYSTCVFELQVQPNRQQTDLAKIQFKHVGYDLNTSDLGVV